MPWELEVEEMVSEVLVLSLWQSACKTGAKQKPT